MTPGVVTTGRIRHAAPAGPANRARLAGWLPVVAGAVAMAVAGSWGLGRGSAMGNDEVATRYAARLSLGQLGHLLSHVDAVHGFYYLLMHAWMAVGSSPLVMRIPSVLSMTAAAALLVITGRRLTGSVGAGLFAALIMALTPAITFYAQTARSYALVFATVLAATLALVHALEAETSGAARARQVRWWAGYAALVTLAGYLNELALLMLAAHAVTVLLARYGRRPLVHWLAAAAAGTIVVIPLIVVSSREAAAVGWIPRPSLHDGSVLFHDYFGGSTVAAALVLCCACVAVAAPTSWARHGADRDGAGGGQHQARWRSGGVSLPSVALPLLIAPAAMLVAESLLARPFYVDRYVLYGEAGAALLAGAGIHRLGQWLATRSGRSQLAWSAGVVVCVCALALQLGPLHRVRTPGSRMFDFGGPSFYLAAHARPGDGVLFFSPFYRKARLGYPEDFRDVTDFAMAASPQQAGTFNGTNKPPAVIDSLMLRYQRIWVLGRSPDAVLCSPPIKAQSIMLRDHFTLVTDRHYKGIVLTRWLRR